MKIAVCYKNVPDDEKIKTAADRTLDLSAAAPAIGQYDLNAMEAAAQLAAANAGSEVIALTVAGDVINNTKQRKAILSRGADRMVGVYDAAFDTADTLTIAQAIAKAVETIGGVDLILFGEGSADMYAQQTGPMTGALLGWANVNAVSAISADGGTLEVKRDLESSSETLRVKLPAVLSVTSDINRPRIPAMKDILSAGKKPVEVMSAADAGAETASVTETVSVLAPETVERAKKVYESADDEAIEAIALEIKRHM